MRKISLSIVCSALVCSSVALANNPTENATDLKGMKPFVGFMVGTLTETASTTISGSAIVLSITSFQTGLWGGLEFNFMDNLGVRAYVNMITTALPINSTTNSVRSSSRMIFNGNVDLIYRPTDKLGIFIGFGLGDMLIGSTYKSNTRTETNLDNYFAMFGNFGVQYNINTNNILELSAILNSMFEFTTIERVSTTTGTAIVKTQLYAPNVLVSHNIMMKYAYRF